MAKLNNGKLISSIAAKAKRKSWQPAKLWRQRKAGIVMA